MSRFFNTPGPCRPDWHYMLPAAARLPEVPQLVRQQGYFVVRGPRWVGQTSALWGVAEELTASGRFAALILSCESARAAGDDHVAARPDGFPASVGLCGLREVRDDEAPSGGDPAQLLSSDPFNVLMESFRLGDFTVDEVAALYAQRTEETGQEFTNAGVEYAYELTRGQPRLVNALALEAVIMSMGALGDAVIGPRRLEMAKERLIEQRVQSILGPGVAFDEAATGSGRPVRLLRA